MIIKLFTALASHLIRRGTGYFKILFVIDDFFRLFAMTILIPLFFRWLHFGDTLVTAGVILGLVIDLHDFISDAGIAKIDSGIIPGIKK